MTRAKRGASSPLKIPVIILAVVVVLLYALAGFQIAEHASRYQVEFDARDYIHSAESGRFGDLYDTALMDMDKNTTYSTEVAECRALAFYYEQAVLEHAYRGAGDTEKADKAAKRMKEYEAQLGSMSAKAKTVQQLVSG